MTQLDASRNGVGRRIGFKRHLRTEVIAGDATYLLSEAGVSALSGDDLAALAPLLDGSRDVPAVLDAVGARVGPVRAGQLLGQLMAAGLVRYLGSESPSEPPVGGSDEAYWDLAGLDGSAAVESLARVTVDLICVGDADPAAVSSALIVAGVGVALHDPVVDAGCALAVRFTGDPDLAVVITDDYLRPELATLDRLFAARGLPWLLARARGAAPWIGPIFGADDGACWECLAHRLRANRVRETPLHGRGDGHAPIRPPAAHTTVTEAFGAQLTGLFVTQWIAGLRRSDQRAVRIHDTIAGTTTTHELRRRPQCTLCGQPDLVALRSAEAVAIRSTPKSTGEGTGHRAVASAQTYAAYEHLVSPVTGVVAELRRDARVPDGMHCYLAGRNPAAGANTRTALTSGLRQMCGGKGATDIDARTSALCEALERFSGQLHGDELRIRARHADRDDTLDPAEVMLFDPRQRAEGCIPDALDPDAVIDWTPMWSLISRRHVLLPTALLYFGQPAAAGVEPVRGRQFAIADSNGNAAGSTVEDAIVQGFLELVERDAVALWWYNRTTQPGVDLDAFAEPWLDAQRALHASMGRELTVLDVTSDFGIPVLVSVSRRPGPGPEDICFGFGAHFDPTVALRRAVAEVAQLMPAVLPDAGTGADHTTTDPTLLSWWADATIARHPYLRADDTITRRGPRRWAYQPRADLADDVAAICRLVDERGLDLLVLDQTRPDIGLPVVKVVVPGLRHFWRRLAPGRLDQIPVTLGRLDVANRYAEFNPVEMFL